MKQLLFLLLFPCLCMAQYQGNAGQKITLGEQTTADGLVYRGVLADTGNITPFSDTSAYIILDTVNNRFFHYRRNTNVWSVAGGSDTSLIAYVNTYGPQTVNGVKTFNDTLQVNKGIRFPALQASSTNALVLDDYEEGVFSIAIRGSGTAGTYQLSQNFCRYTKIGNSVTIYIRITFASSITGGGSGYMQITGFPFNNKNTTGANGIVYPDGLDFSAGKTFLVASPETVSGTSTWYLIECGDNITASDFPISGVSANDIISISSTYFTE